MKKPGALTIPESKIGSMVFWQQSPEKNFEVLGSKPAGLSENEAASRLNTIGFNSLDTRRKTTPLGLFFNQFKSPIILILLAATIVSAFVQDWTDAVIILVIVMGSAILSFSQEYNASNAARKLRQQVTLKAKVLREGKEMIIPAEYIVPGDVVLLAAGSLIPADGILLEAKDLFVNQAVLTGETFPVEKKPGIISAGASLEERTNCIFMGTNVRSGSGKALIFATGVHTNFGKIAKRLTLRPPETEFERGIHRLGYLLTEVMFVLVVSIFALNVFFQKPILDALLFSIALAVGLTPQLLPAIININLSKGSQTMAAKGVIVRRLASIENFGSMDILCTDKTGTLTLGVIKLDGALDTNGIPSDIVLHASWLNATLQSGMANPLDEAIQKSGSLVIREDAKVDEIPYDFVRKRLGIVVNESEFSISSSKSNCTLISKGAFENVLEVCNQLLIERQVLPLDDASREALVQRYEDWSSKGYRVLGVAAKSVEKKERYEREDEEEMIFLGFLLFFDPPKPDVHDTIMRLEKLGVKLKIITGDNRLVATNIANSIGLANPKVMTGSELDNLHNEAIWHSVEQTDIFAEVDPAQKERIILALKKIGHVVGYMGDGINDAPSLHSADVSISVENAVDVAKEAADFVLLKQDLDILEQGILQGRRTFANTLKYVFMATSANFGNMFSVAGASLFLPFLPMLPKQILLINFLTDLPEMAIAGDQVDDVFVQKPHRWDVAFIRRFMLIFGSLSSLFDFATFAALLWGFKASQETFHTGWFIESVLSASLVVFAVRTRLPFHKSHPSRIMIFFTALVGLAALLLPYSPLARLMGFTALPPLTLVIILIIIVIYFFSAELAKHWFYRKLSNND
ncbi:MAG: magnesium-translocating P-type ATPase [Anaerolineaceae bacterium]|nr:magnesium-translocating P-type ATPase [Anaerolineaceae bacterium]